VADVSWGASQEEIPKILDHSPWFIGKIGKTSVAGTSKSPNDAKQNKNGYQITRPHMDG
jgi:hypothetical protein